MTPLGKEIVPVKCWSGKRLFDVIISVVLLFCLTPLMLLIAMLIKISSRGHVFYRDARLGIGGHVYSMLKFRTMKDNAKPLLDGNGKLIVGKHDSRLTPVGSILRKLHLDESPQLINVLLGDMSFVGPRSGQPAYEYTYSDNAYERLRVKPGITGLGAVVGGRHIQNDSLYAVEAAYVARQCLWLDLRIIFCTPLYILFGKSATRKALADALVGIGLHEINNQGEQ